MAKVLPPMDCMVPLSGAFPCTSILVECKLLLKPSQWLGKALASKDVIRHVQGQQMIG